MLPSTGFRLFTGAVLFAALLGCTEESRSPPEGGQRVIVFKHGKVAGDPERFKALLHRFEATHPGLKVKDETLPASTDEQHQFYAINLEAGSSDFDVLSMDVIWVQEFARAGWVRDLGHLVPESERKDFFPGPIEAVTFNGSPHAIPWYIDAGVLYYRKDLLEKYGLAPPATWGQLVKIAQRITAREPNLYGYVWQGKQYEGLVCNVLEFFRGNGGDVLRQGSPVVDSPENLEAIAFMRDLVTRFKVSPPLVTTAMEEPTRHIFGNGGALFMRNWPYAWNIFNAEDSPVKGKVGVAPLPSFPGHPSASTLGGWQLGVNRFSKRLQAAEKLVRFLTSPETQKTMALTIGYKPTRKSVYQDSELMANQPFITSLYEILLNARPRPVSPYYMMMTQVLQAEFSAVLSGIKTPEDGLRTTQALIRHILEAER
ncbi:MAG: ABC transporter substrate-binding protein [Thermodesulfobacteriota bacterium]